MLRVTNPWDGSQAYATGVCEAIAYGQERVAMYLENGILYGLAKKKGAIK